MGVLVEVVVGVSVIVPVRVTVGVSVMVGVGVIVNVWVKVGVGVAVVIVIGPNNWRVRSSLSTTSSL